MKQLGILLILKALAIVACAATFWVPYNEDAAAVWMCLSFTAGVMILMIES